MRKTTHHGNHRNAIVRAWKEGYKLWAIAKRYNTTQAEAAKIIIASGVRDEQVPTSGGKSHMNDKEARLFAEVIDKYIDDHENDKGSLTQTEQNAIALAHLAAWRNVLQLYADQWATSFERER